MLTAEKLSEIDGIDISDETVRNWLIERTGNGRKDIRERHTVNGESVKHILARCCR